MRQLQAVGRETKPKGRIDQTESRAFGQPGVSKRQGRMAYMWLPTVCVRSFHSRMAGVGKGWAGDGGGGGGGGGRRRRRKRRGRKVSRSAVTEKNNKSD